MKFIAVTIFSLVASMMIAVGAVADPAASANAGGQDEAACEQRQQQCMKSCDKEKRMWFFKGAAYETCAEKCVARHQACMSAGPSASERGQEMQEGAAAAGDARTRAADRRSNAESQRDAARADSEELRDEVRTDAAERRNDARAAAEERRNTEIRRRDERADADDAQVIADEEEEIEKEKEREKDDSQ